MSMTTDNVVPSAPRQTESPATPPAYDSAPDRFVPVATAGAVLFTLLLIFFGRG